MAIGIGAYGDRGGDGSSTAGPAHLTLVASSHRRPVAGDTGSPLPRRYVAARGGEKIRVAPAQSRQYRFPADISSLAKAESGDLPWHG
jgi:hypothetical protein